MKEMEITAKTTKKALVDYLKQVKVADKTLTASINYAIKMFGKDQTKVLKDDLIALVQEVKDFMTPAPAPVEASLKPKKGGLKAKVKAKIEEVEAEDAEAEDEEEVVEETAVTKEETPKKTEKKSTLKKPAQKKKAEVETMPPASNVGVDNLPSAKIFPAEIEVNGEKLVACTGKYTKIEDFIKDITDEENPKTLYIACYWTKRHIKEYAYAATRQVPKDNEFIKKGFPNDLDVLQAVLPCSTMPRVYAMSVYTEALYQFEGEDFEYIEDTDPRSGDKFRIRASAGMEFEIYQPADEA